jgi:hypothetical protein
MKFVLALALVVVVIVVVITTVLVTRHNNFETAFSVPAPWFMSQGEKDLLQPYVTTKLGALAAAVAALEAEKCGSDASCMKSKLIAYQAAQKALDDAVDAARHKDFDVTIPPPPKPPCTDGKEPVDGQCADGSTPTKQ